MPVNFPLESSISCEGKLKSGCLFCFLNVETTRIQYKDWEVLKRGQEAPATPAKHRGSSEPGSGWERERCYSRPAASRLRETPGVVRLLDAPSCARAGSLGGWGAAPAPEGVERRLGAELELGSGRGESDRPQVQEKYKVNGSISFHVSEIPSCLYVSPHGCVKWRLAT